MINKPKRKKKMHKNQSMRHIKQKTEPPRAQNKTKIAIEYISK